MSKTIHLSKEEIRKWKEQHKEEIKRSKERQGMLTHLAVSFSYFAEHPEYKGLMSQKLMKFNLRTVPADEYDHIIQGYEVPMEKYVGDQQDVHLILKRYNRYIWNNFPYDEAVKHVAYIMNTLAFVIEHKGHMKASYDLDVMDHSDK